MECNSDEMGDDHFYTTSVPERDSAVNNAGYHVEGLACYISPSQITGSTEFIRLFNSGTGDHFYTTSVSEANNAVAHVGYHIEGAAGFIFANQVSNTSALYRLFNGTDHFYTASPTERDTAIANNGYHLEGVAGFIYLTDQGGTTQTFWRLFNGGHPINKATSVSINSITYDTAHAAIQKTDTVNLYTDKVSNSTAVSQTSTISGSQQITDTSGWSDTITVSVQAKASLSVGIPLVVGGNVEVSVGLQNAVTFNGSETRQTTWNWSQPLTVPANSAVDVDVFVSQSSLSVPYTTNSTFSFPDGSSTTCETFGTYNGMNSHDLQVDIT